MTSHLELSFEFARWLNTCYLALYDGQMTYHSHHLRRQNLLRV